MDAGISGGHDGGSHHGGAFDSHHHHSHHDTGSSLGSYGSDDGYLADADGGRPYGGRGGSSPWAAPVAVAVVVLFLIVLAFLAN